MVIDAFEEYFVKKRYFLYACLIVFSMLSAMTCYDTLIGVMEPMSEKFYNYENYKPEMFDEQYIYNANNFFGSTDSFFYTYIAKHND